jgi:hypothetical protein
VTSDFVQATEPQRNMHAKFQKLNLYGSLPMN